MCFSFLTSLLLVHLGQGTYAIPAPEWAMTDLSALFNSPLLRLISFLKSSQAAVRCGPQLLPGSGIAKFAGGCRVLTVASIRGLHGSLWR